MPNRKWKLYKNEFTGVYTYIYHTFLNNSFQIMKRFTVITSKIMQTGPHTHILTKRRSACLLVKLWKRFK